MVELLAALALAPWSQPLLFQPMAGWHTGASGNTRSAYVGRNKRATTPLESTAWIAHGTRYLDPATADPPNQTLAALPKGAVIVWAVIYSPAASGDQRIRLDLARARRYACCEAAPIPAEYELTGTDAHRTYSAIIRIYFGSTPNLRLRGLAQLALRHLRLPVPH